LATEWKRIGFIDQLPAPNWTDDPALVDQFIAMLEASPHIQYLHFIGGETLITPAFQTILEALIRSGLNRTATIGFTTNLTVWDSQVIDLLTQFHGVNLGMSVESFEIVNDYVRWPSKLPVVLENLDRWQELARQQEQQINNLEVKIIESQKHQHKLEQIIETEQNLRKIADQKANNALATAAKSEIARKKAEEITLLTKKQARHAVTQASQTVMKFLDSSNHLGNNNSNSNNKEEEILDNGYLETLLNSDADNNHQ
jgi:hypothetical protein